MNKFIRRYFLIALIVLVSFMLTSCIEKAYKQSVFSKKAESNIRPMFNEYVSDNTTIKKRLDIKFEFENYEEVRLPIIGSKLVFDSFDAPERGYTSLVNYHKVKLILELENDEQIILDSIGDGGKFSPPESYRYAFTSREYLYDNKWSIDCNLYYMPYNAPEDNERTDDFIYFDSDLTIFEDFVQLVELNLTLSYTDGDNHLYEQIKMLMYPIEYFNHPKLDIQEGYYKILDGENNYFVNQKTLNVVNQDVITDFDNFEFKIDRVINNTEFKETNITYNRQVSYTVNALVESSKLNQSYNIDCKNHGIFSVIRQGVLYDMSQDYNFPTGSINFGLFNNTVKPFDPRVAVIAYSIQDDLVLNGVTYEKHQGLLVRLLIKMKNDDCIERYFTMYLDDFE